MLLDDEIPLICGGADDVVGLRNTCYTYVNQAWKANFSMNEYRMHYFGMPSSPYQYPSHKFFVAGTYVIVIAMIA